MTHALDGFAGPGGWSLACKWLGIDEVGIENDKGARATRWAAGFRTVWDDITTVEFWNRSDGHPLFSFGHGDAFDGLIMSPPCQSFSAAGKRTGLEDPRGQLAFQVMRYAKAIRPQWIACEQVPAVLPIWQQFAGELEEMGYKTWAGYLHAEQYGVPQTRKRAILMAHRDRNVTPPQPTHSKYHPRSPEKLDEGVKPWVSMAEALGWGLSGRPSPTITGGGTDAGGAEPIAHLSRYTKREDWVLRNDQKVRLSVEEAGILQSFPADFPWQGSRTKQFQQVGNAIPPVLAAAILEALL